jgi:hypothetical protein
MFWHMNDTDQISMPIFAFPKLKTTGIVLRLRISFIFSAGKKYNNYFKRYFGLTYTEQAMLIKTKKILKLRKRRDLLLGNFYGEDFKKSILKSTDGYQLFLTEGSYSRLLTGPPDKNETILFCLPLKSRMVCYWEG